MNHILNQLTIDDLPEPYKTIAELSDVTTAIKLAEHFGGSQVTFQKLDTALYILKERLIKDEFNGYNYEDLARKYNCSTSWVRRITSDIVHRERNKPLDGQMTVFDLK